MKGRLGALAVPLTLATCGPAHAAQLVAIDTPSRNVDPSHVRFSGSDHSRRLRANVLLPDGYDGRRRFPVLFLLHGVGDSFETWTSPSRGDILNSARGLDAIVVMPEAARGFYSNWWNGGRRGDPGWERFYLDELVPLVERSFRVKRGRRWHAIAGASMGGLGAAYLASQLPGYFGAAATFSGFVAHQRPEVGLALQAVGQVSYTDIFGSMNGFYATGHNPARLAQNLRSTRLYVTSGNGIAETGVAGAPSTVVTGGLVEAGLRLEAEELVKAARAAGVDVTHRPRGGVHDWPYWRRHLRDAIAWGLFEPVPDAPPSWSYRTVASRGEAWGLRYVFAEPPGQVTELAAAGGVLRARGTGTVTVSNGAECGFTARLPFERSLPPGVCGRLRVRMRPRTVLLGRTTRVRFRVIRQVGTLRLPVRGARVRLGRHATRTNGRGRATLRYPARGRPGRRRARVVVSGLRAARPALRVLRRRPESPGS